jgi:hypothetical protein
VLGAVIISAAIGLVDPDAWRALWDTDRVEFSIAAVTTAGVVAYGVLEALAFAVGLSIIDVVRRSASPHDAVLGWVEKLGRYADASLHPSAKLTPGVVVYRLDDRLFFANAGYVKAHPRGRSRSPPGQLRCVRHEPSRTSTPLGSRRCDTVRPAEGRHRVGDARAKSPLKERLDEVSLTGEIGGRGSTQRPPASMPAADGRESVRS